MAGEWIKVRTNLWNDPRVSQLVDMTGTQEATIVGALYWLWASADEHTETGLMAGLSVAAIDRKTSVKGFGAALLAIGWIAETDGGIVVVRFDEHNGSSAKQRAQTAKRVANHKCNKHVTTAQIDAKEAINHGCNTPVTTQDGDDLHSEVTQSALPERYQSVSDALPERYLEKRREEVNQPPTASPSSDDVRSCPAGSLVDLYHELMPNNPRIKVLNAARKSAIRARWIEAAKLNCAPFGYKTKSEGLDAWRKFFSICAESKFLTGLSPPSHGKPAFIADIDFIFSPSGFAKTLENKYHRDLP